MVPQELKNRIEELKIHLHSTSDDKIIKTVSIMLMLEMDRKNYMKSKGKHNGNSNNNDLQQTLATIIQITNNNNISMSEACSTVTKKIVKV